MSTYEYDEDDDSMEGGGLGQSLTTPRKGFMEPRKKPLTEKEQRRHAEAHSYPESSQGRNLTSLRKGKVAQQQQTKRKREPVLTTKHILNFEVEYVITEQNYKTIVDIHNGYVAELHLFMEQFNSASYEVQQAILRHITISNFNQYKKTLCERIDNQLETQKNMTAKWTIDFNKNMNDLRASVDKLKLSMKPEPTTAQQVSSVKVRKQAQAVIGALGSVLGQAQAQTHAHTPPPASTQQAPAPAPQAHAQTQAHIAHQQALMAQEKQLRKQEQLSRQSLEQDLSKLSNVEKFKDLSSIEKATTAVKQSTKQYQSIKKQISECRRMRKLIRDSKSKDGQTSTSGQPLIACPENSRWCNYCLPTPGDCEKPYSEWRKKGGYRMKPASKEYVRHMYPNGRCASKYQNKHSACGSDTALQNYCVDDPKYCASATLPSGKGHYSFKVEA